MKWQVYMHMKHLRSKNYKKWMRIFDKLHTMLFAANKMGNFIFKIWKAEQFYDQKLFSIWDVAIIRICMFVVNKEIWKVALICSQKRVYEAKWKRAS